MRNGDRVVQMVPAAGYYAAYQHDDEITYNPVAVWIVIEPSGDNWDGSPCSYAKTSWSSYTGTSENAADDTTTAPRPSDVMNRDGPGGKGASLQSRLSAYSRRPRAHVVDQVALQFGPVGHLVGEVPAVRPQDRVAAAAPRLHSQRRADQRRPGHQVCLPTF
jgi:hypothetical protein